MTGSTERITGRITVALVALVLVGTFLVATPATPAAQAVALRTPPVCCGTRWSRLLHPYVRVGVHHYYNVALPASVKTAIGSTRLDAIHRYWRSFDLQRPLRLVAGPTGRHGYIARRWYGFKVVLDEYLSEKVFQFSVGAAAIATAISVLGVWPAGVIAGVIAADGAMLKACRKANGYTYLYWVSWNALNSIGVLACNPF